MLYLKTFSKLTNNGLRCQPKFFSTQLNETQNARPYKDIPGPSMFKLVKESVLPGGLYYNLSFTDMMTKFRDEYGPIVKVPGAFGKNDFVMVFLPDDIEKVNRTEGKRPIRRGIESFEYFRKNYRQDIFKESRGLGTTQGEEWYNFRSKVNAPLMQPKITKLYVPKIDAVAKDFVKKIRKIRDGNNEVPTDFYENLNDFGLESIGVIALDKRLGVIDNPNSSKLNRMAKDMFVSMYELDVKPNLWRYFKTPGFKRAMKNYEEMTDIINNLITDAIDKRESSQSNEDNEGVLDKLLKIDKNIAIVMVQDMLVGGIDTTAITAAIILYCLAKNPDKQEILRKEIFKLLPEKDTELTASSLSQIPYLRACMKEAMRLYPPAAGNMRGLIQDLVLQGYIVPKDTDIVMPSITSTDERYFKQAKQFIPERWLKDNTDPRCPQATDSHPYAFLPFGHGTRMCIGRRFAEVELDVLMARILREFKLEWHNPDLKFKSSVFNSPADPLKFKFLDLC